MKSKPKNPKKRHALRAGLAYRRHGSGSWVASVCRDSDRKGARHSGAIRIDRVICQMFVTHDGAVWAQASR